MSNTMQSVRDARRFGWFPITRAALQAIREAAPPRRLSYAIALYTSVVDLANEQRGHAIACSRKQLSELSGVSRDLISDLRPVLEAAGVVRVVEHHHGNERTENEWILVEPEVEATSHGVEADSHGGSRPAAPGVEADSHGGGGQQPQRSQEVKDKPKKEDVAASPDDDDRVRGKSGIVAPPEAVDLCKRLATMMRRNDAHVPLPARGSANAGQWLDDARLLITKDRPGQIEEIRRVLEWSQADVFWRGNILSMGKFRAQYPKLRNAANANGSVTRRVGGQDSMAFNQAQLDAEKRFETNASQ
jgi:hypothetical protein